MYGFLTFMCLAKAYRKNRTEYEIMTRRAYIGSGRIDKAIVINPSMVHKAPQGHRMRFPDASQASQQVKLRMITPFTVVNTFYNQSDARAFLVKSTPAKKSWPGRHDIGDILTIILIKVWLRCGCGVFAV